MYCYTKYATVHYFGVAYQQRVVQEESTTPYKQQLCEPSQGIQYPLSFREYAKTKEKYESTVDYRCGKQSLERYQLVAQGNGHLLLMSTAGSLPQQLTFKLSLELAIKDCSYHLYSCYSVQYVTVLQVQIIRF